MKNSKYHILCARILLICFIAGQYMVYAHQHVIYKSAAHAYSKSKDQPRETVTEKCAVCDAMHNNSMVNAIGISFHPVAANVHIFKTFDYDFKSISLILSGGRAPPILNNLS